MKTIAKTLTVIAIMLLGFNTMAQDNQAQIIKLEQKTGDFNLKGITLSPGDYIFEVSNNGVDHAVGLAIAPKGKTDAEHHIKEGYLKKTVENGKSAQSNVITLTKGEYVYFCPLNPTPEYTIKVE